LLCINPSGNCAGGCGKEASNCAIMQLGSCPTTETDDANCNGNIGLDGCFVEGSTCSQTTNTKMIVLILILNV